MSTTLANFLAEANIHGWSVSTNAGPINLRDYAMDCSEEELAGEVNVIDDNGRVTVREIGSDGYEVGGDALITGNTHEFCEYSGCRLPATALVEPTHDVPYGLCSEHRAVEATETARAAGV